MIRKHRGRAPLFLAPNLASYRELLHAVSARQGGVSTGPYASLNLSFDVGDRQDRVLQNYHRLSRLLKFDLRSLVTCQQIHHNTIALIDESYLNSSVFLPARAVPETDGLATDVPGITLLTRHADCVPLLFYNHKKQTVALAHAGWQGTLARIGPVMMDLLTAQFKCQPEQTMVAVGPSIGPCCYQISSSMANLAVKQIPLAEQCILTSSGGQLSFDLWQANKKQLIAAGIKENHIFSAGLCTSCNAHFFFSYRKEAKVTGRFGALIGIRKRNAV